MTSELEAWAQLNDKVVMVTGASSGIGRELSLDLAKAGCRIIAAARRLDRLDSLCAQINRHGRRAVAVELDVGADGTVIEAAVQRAWEAFGTVDVLINNAGVTGNPKPLSKSTEEEWNSIFKINLTGTWLMSKYVCSRMSDAKKGGSVINISSIGGLNRGLLPVSYAYCASKAAVITLTKLR